MNPSRFHYASKPLLGAQLDRGHRLARGMVGCLLLNEQGGGTVFDLASGAVGTANAGVARTGSPDGGALSFNGANGDVTINGVSQTGTAVSVATRLKFAGFGDSMFVERETVNLTWELFIQTNLLKWRGSSASDRFRSLAYTSLGMTTGTWYSLIATDNGNSNAGDVNMYLNGAALANQVVPSATPPTTDSYKIHLGNYDNSGYYFSGQMDYAYIWNRALSSYEAEWIAAEPYAMIAPPGVRRFYSIPAGGTVWSGSAGLTGVGLSAGATQAALSGSSSPAGVGLTAAGQSLGAAGSGLPAGVALFAGSGQWSAGGSGQLSGIGLTAAGMSLGATGTAGLAAVGLLTPNGALTVSGSALLTGVAVLTGSFGGGTVWQGFAQLAGVGLTGGVGGAGMTGQQALSGVGQVSPAAQIGVIGAAQILAVGQAVPVGQIATVGAGQLLGIGLVFPAGSLGAAGSAALSGLAVFSGAAQRGVLAAMQLVSAGLVSAAPVAVLVGAQILAGVGSVAPAGQGIYVGSVALAGAGVLTGAFAGLTSGALLYLGPIVVTTGGDGVVLTTGGDGIVLTTAGQ
ncbi:MAG: LamG domain-containing protein [Chloroflexi bacterium]|nr:LamG domain-containing protein [Chloroflexota bacterium]